MNVRNISTTTYGRGRKRFWRPPSLIVNTFSLRFALWGEFYQSLIDLPDGLLRSLFLLRLKERDHQFLGSMCTVVSCWRGGANSAACDFGDSGMRGRKGRVWVCSWSIRWDEWGLLLVWACGFSLSKKMSWTARDELNADILCSSSMFGRVSSPRSLRQSFGRLIFMSFYALGCFVNSLWVYCGYGTVGFKQTSAGC